MGVPAHPCHPGMIATPVLEETNLIARTSRHDDISLERQDVLIAGFDRWPDRPHHHAVHTRASGLDVGTSGHASTIVAGE